MWNTSIYMSSEHWFWFCPVHYFWRGEATEFSFLLQEALEWDTSINVSRMMSNFFQCLWLSGSLLIIKCAENCVPKSEGIFHRLCIVFFLYYLNFFFWILVTILLMWNIYLLFRWLIPDFIDVSFPTIFLLDCINIWFYF